MISASIEDFQDVIKALPQKIRNHLPWQIEMFCGHRSRHWSHIYELSNVYRIKQLNSGISALKSKTDLGVDVSNLHEAHLEEKADATNKLVENVVEFYLLNQFQAALPVDLRRVINLQPMHTLDLDTAVRLAMIELHSKDEARGTTSIQAVQQDEEEDGVEAVAQNCQKKFFPQNQQNRGQQYHQNFQSQNN